MSSAFLYTRVSHHNSELSGISTDDQVKCGQQYALTLPGVQFSNERFSHDDPGVFCDRAISGWSRPFSLRPAGSALLSHIRQGDHVIFYSVDRAARNVRDFCNTIWEMERRGAYIHYISDQINSASAIGKFQLNMRAAAAQFFSDLASERIREALAIRRMQQGVELKYNRSKTRWVANVDLVQNIPAVSVDRPVNRILMYERVSSDQQYISGLGLEHQSISIKTAAERLHAEHGGLIDRLFSDPAVSAYSKKFSERKAGGELLEYAQPGDDIVIYRVDRAWRNPADAMEMAKILAEKQIYLHFVNEGIRTDTRQGAEWITVIAAMAHMESTLKSVRTKRALDECRRQGRRIGGQMPAGMGATEIRPGVKKLVVDKDEVAKRQIPMLINEVLGLRRVDTDRALTALHCYDNKEKATLKHVKDWKVWEQIQYCKRLRDTLSPTLWEDTLEMARARLHIPIERKYWYRPKWEGDSMTIADYSLSAR
jgi:DNA invertase Pin-like site-specific DNA recombinase